MKRMVRIRNNTNSDVQFGEQVIPSLGTLHMAYPDYSEVVKKYSIQAWGLSVEVRDIEFKNVSVKDFGAKGDGVSDDTYQFQSAIDYVVGNGGGIVNVPVGVYFVSQLFVSGNTVLVGESRTESVIKSNSSSVRPVISFSGGECGARTLRVVM